MPKEEKGDNSFGVAGLVFSVLSIPFALFPIFGMAFAVLGIVFAFIQRKRANNKWVTSAIVVAIIGAIFSILLWIGYVALAREIVSQLQQMQASGALPTA